MPAMRKVSVCPSVCLSNACIVTKRKKDLSRFLCHTIVFWKEDWLVGRPFLPEILAQPASLEQNRRFWTDNRSCLSRNTYQKSLININRKFTTCFPMSLRWSSYVVPKSPKRDSKTQNGRFSCKIALRWKKVCYGFFVWKIATKL